MALTFEERLAYAELSLAQGFSTKQAKKDAIDTLNRAHDEVMTDIRNRLLAERDAGKRDGRSKEFLSLYYTPDGHAWNAKRAALYSCYPDLKARADECAALRARVKAAELVAKKPSARQAAIAKAAEKAMHCQICARPIFAELGTIAHHGYERPGTGWQTASCYGAKRLPYEASRDAIEELIPGMVKRIASMEQARRDVLAEREPVTRTGEKRGEQYRYGRGGYPTYTVRFTRETMPYALYFCSNAFPQHTGSVQPDGTLFDYGKAKTVDAFDYFKNEDAKERAVHIRQARDWLKYLEKRRDDWKGATHTYVDRTKGWVAKTA